MSYQPPVSAKGTAVKGPRGPKLWLILTGLACLFGLALILILIHGPGYSGPAQVRVITGSSDGQVAEVQTPSNVPANSSAPLSLAPPEPDVASAPPIIGYPAESRKASKSVRLIRESNPVEKPGFTPRYRRGLTQKADLDEQISRTSSNSNANSSNRSFNQIDHYYAREEGNRFVRSVPENIEVLGYPNIRTSNLAEALQKPNFEIKLRAAKALKVEGTAIESGEYILKPKWDGTHWHLLFFGSNAANPSAVLTLSADRAPTNVNRLYVFVYESEKKVSVVIQVGRDRLLGRFEIE